MTFRELLNEVLTRLREPTIATDWTGPINDSNVVSDYHKTVAALINDSKRNVEQYYDWMILRETVEITTVSGTRSYSLNSGQEIKILDVVDQNTGQRLKQASRAYMNDVRYPTESDGEPIYYAFNGKDSFNNLKVELAPKPDVAHTLSFDIVKYQDKLINANDVLSVPEQPVILGAWARAIAERGEDGGTQSSIVATEYADAIHNSISLDNSNAQYELDWYVEQRYHG